jgi:glycosyltransferase involved in cell wall biosynthesis
MGERMKLAIVVQRYGTEINGGAELHARYLAEHLARHAEVRVLTTCARDYITWRNDLPPGEERVNGVAVERFPVSQERDRNLVEFGRRSTHVFTMRHSIDDELDWLSCEGPVSPSLLDRLESSGDEFTYVLVFSVRYHTAYHAARKVSTRAILVPTVERESSLGLAIFPPVLRGVRAIMYNSFEEQTMIQALAGNAHVPGVVVGIGSEIPQRSDGERARRKFGLRNRFIVYVGRIDVNKGCAELFELFTWYLKVSHLALRDQEIDLVLIGAAMLKIPDHPHIRHLGYVSDDDKFDVIAAAELLVMPSFYESLSMVALEAWALGKPVLVNARCDVLLGQALRSNAGLYYETASDFAGALDALLDRTSLASAMGENGRRYYSQHYDWSVIEQKYLEMFRRLAADPPRHAMEPLPGSRERRRRDKPPASEVVLALPRGAVRRPTADEVSST